MEGINDKYKWKDTVCNRGDTEKIAIHLWIKMRNATSGIILPKRGLYDLPNTLMVW